MKKLLVLLFFIVCSTIVTASCGPCGSTITASCTLDSNLTATGQTCFRVLANNVVIDGAGYTITGDQTTDRYGIHLSTAAQAFNNITIKNLEITNFHHGIFVQSSPNSTIINNNIYSNTNDGIHVENSNFINISLNNIELNAKDGIRILATLFATILDNDITENNQGVFFSSNSNNNQLVNNYICQNTADINDSDSNSGSNNTCDVPIGWQDIGTLGCTYNCTGDSDSDGIPNDIDNCPFTPNPGQEDSDSDEFGDVCDNCPNNYNPDQADSDADGVGNVCDGCPDDPAKTQPGVCGCGNADVDSDQDSHLDCQDNCPLYINPDQDDWDSDGEGNECDCNDFFKGDFETGADCGGICINPCPACIPLIKNGLHQDKIDIVLMPDFDYIGNMSGFIDDAMWIIENSYFGADEIYNERCKFNFYYLPYYSNYTPMCGFFIHPNFYDFCSFADSAAIIYSGGGRACSTSKGFSIPYRSKKTAVHETGHQFWSLADEYSADGSYWENSFYANVYQTEASCQAKSMNASSCKEFCPDYRYFPDDPTQIANCQDWWLKKKGIVDAPYCSCYDYLMNLSVDPGFCTAAGLDPVPEVWKNYYAAKNVTDLTSLNVKSPYYCNYRGKGIQQCCGSGWWKSDPNNCYMRSGDIFREDCSRRVEYELNQLPVCTNPGDNESLFSKAFVMIFLQEEFRIILDDVYIVFNQPPDQFPQNYYYQFQQYTSNNQMVHQSFMSNPMEYKLEEPLPFEEFDEPTIYEVNRTDFVMIMPFLNYSKRIKIVNTSNTTLLDIDLSDAILEFCRGRYDDPQCQVSDLDNDTIKDETDNCPKDPNPAQLDTNGDGIGDACTFGIELHQGWNLVSSPCQEEENLSIMEPIKDCYEAMYDYNNLWGMLIPGNPFSNIQMIDPKKGYWIKVNCTNINWTCNQIKLPDGDPCTSDDECVSNHCNSNICCRYGDCCTAPSDCDNYYRRPSRCDQPLTCQGHRIDATCINYMCGFLEVGDDTDCLGIWYDDCGFFTDAYCGGELQQEPPGCLSTCIEDIHCDPWAYCDLGICRD